MCVLVSYLSNKQELTISQYKKERRHRKPIKQIHLISSSLPEIIVTELAKMSSSNEPPNVNSLPNELISHIFSFLDVAPPSASTTELLDEPHFNLTCSQEAPLKASSRVSKLWRGLSLPFLFKHAQFELLQTPESADISVHIEQIRPFLHFITIHELNRNVESLTCIARRKNLSFTPDLLSFWDLLLAAIDPDVLTLVATPQALAILTTLEIEMEDAWAFNIPCQYLRLEKPASTSNITCVTLEDIDALISRNRALLVSNPPADHNLPNWLGVMTTRDWTKILLNEGSFIRGYATYEWWQRNPPSVSSFL